VFVQEHQTPLVGQYQAASDKFYAEYTGKTLCIAFYTVDWSFDHREGRHGVLYG